MRHAYMIIAHNQFDLLERIIFCLDNPNSDIYIHIDAKVKTFDFDYFSKLTKYSKIVFTERVSVSWGGFSQIQCELTLLKAAIKGNYDYYHLLSGVDLPLRSSEYIHAFFEEHVGKEFIHFSTPEYCKSDNVNLRIQYYHFLQDIAGRSQGWMRFATQFLRKAQKILGVNRLRRNTFEVKCGANWFSITHELAEYILSQENWIQKYCGNSFCADEVFLQTLVWNSKFKERIYMPNDKGDYRSCLRYVDWVRGNPYVFRNEDYDELISSEYLFARKFDYQKDKEVCERIVRYVTVGADSK